MLFNVDLNSLENVENNFRLSTKFESHLGTFELTGGIYNARQTIDTTWAWTSQLIETKGNNAALIDVRNAAEWEAGHLPGSRHIPLGYLPDRLQELPRDHTFVVHCQGGGRSAIAASLLQAQGFKNILNFGPGFSGWQTAGKPVET